MMCEAQAVADWARTNDLLLNLAKTKVMILGSELFISALDIDGYALPYNIMHYHKKHIPTYTNTHISYFYLMF